MEDESFTCQFTDTELDLIECALYAYQFDNPEKEQEIEALRTKIADIE